MNTSLRQKPLQSGLAIGSYDIQPSLWPESGISTEIDTYFHLRNAAGCSFKHGGIDFAVGGSAYVNGYFNLFNLGKWRSLCGDMPIHLRLHGHGRFQLTVWAASQDRSRDRIFSEIVVLDGELRLPLDLSKIDHPRIVLYFDLGSGFITSR